MPSARLAGLEIGWDERGRGPPAVLLHPGLARRSIWDELAAGLEDRLRLFLPDLPGHGESGWDPSREIQRQTVDAVRALIDRAGPPVHLVGHSYGGTVALRLAAESPKLVRSLTLIEPVFFVLLHDAGTPESLATYTAHRTATARIEAAFDAVDMTEAARHFLAHWGGGLRPPREGGKRWQETLDGMVLIAASQSAILDSDAPDRMRLGDVAMVSCPVLLIEGAMSPPVIAHIQGLLEQRLGDTHRTVIEGAGHMVPMTHPAEVLAALENHML